MPAIKSPQQDRRRCNRRPSSRQSVRSRSKSGVTTIMRTHHRVRNLQERHEREHEPAAGVERGRDAVLQMQQRLLLGRHAFSSLHSLPTKWRLAEGRTKWIFCGSRSGSRCSRVNSCRLFQAHSFIALLIPAPPRGACDPLPFMLAPQGAMHLPWAWAAASCPRSGPPGSRVHAPARVWQRRGQ